MWAKRRQREQKRDFVDLLFLIVQQYNRIKCPDLEYAKAYLAFLSRNVMFNCC